MYYWVHHVVWFVCLFLCVLGTRVSCTKIHGWTDWDLVYGLTLMGPRNRVLEGHDPFMSARGNKLAVWPSAILRGHLIIIVKIYTWLLQIQTTHRIWCMVFQRLPLPIIVSDVYGYFSYSAAVSLIYVYLCGISITNSELCQFWALWH